MGQGGEHDRCQLVAALSDIAPVSVNVGGYSLSSFDPLQIPRDRRYSVQEAIRKMTVGASLYEPINVFKPMGSDIGIVDGPFEYLTVGGVRLPLPFTTRMTVVRLSNGDLFLQSPIKFDQALASELQRMGTIRHLVSPNQFHYAHIGEWSKGMYYPRGQIFFGMWLPLLLQRRRAKAAFAKIHSWGPERIVLSHGRCFESHGNEVITRIFGVPAP
jgi:hypothetical protein